MDLVGVYALQGDGNAIKIHKGHNSNPAIEFKSICYIDGDSKQDNDHAQGIYRLPGGQPETTVFNSALSNISSNIAILTVSCQRPPDQQKVVHEAIKNVSYANRDSHLLFNQVGMGIGFVAETIVIGAFIAQWIVENKTTVEAVMEPIRGLLSV